jgi:hypothetical protein
VSGKRAILLRDQEVDDFGQHRGICEFDVGAGIREIADDASTVVWRRL